MVFPILENRVIQLKTQHFITRFLSFFSLSLCSHTQNLPPSVLRLTELQGGRTIVCGRKEIETFVLFFPAKDMGTGGKISNAHVISATWHHKHVRPMADDDSDLLRRDIGELLSRWGGLQMAVKNQWGGHDSLKKSHELAHHLFHLFSQSNGSFCLISLVLNFFIWDIYRYG